MTYKLYVEVNGELHLVSEEAWGCDVQNRMRLLEDQVREQYRLGIVHWLVFENNELVDDYWRLWGCEV